MEKVVITAAICGAEVNKEHHPKVPYTLKELVFEAKSAYEAGAAVIHLHVRQDDGTPTQDRERFRMAIEAISKACPEAILLPSTGGAVGMSAGERGQPISLKPEMATIDCGTLNFGGDEIFINTESMIRHFGKQMMEYNVKPELECFDKGMVDTVLRLAKEGWMKAPLHFNFVLGVKGGMAATADNLQFLVKAIPQKATWCVSGIGKDQYNMVAMGILLGGNVRVGFEDNVYLEKGVLAPDNGALVEKAVKLANLLGRPVATPADARRILGLKERLV